MAHSFIFAEKDATVFSRQSRRYQNSGRDEILQIEKTYQDLDLIGGQNQQDLSLPSVSRTVIQFDLDKIVSKIASGSSPKFFLNLKTVEAREVPLAYTIEAFPVSQSWEMGVGRTYDDVTTAGVSWKYRDAINGGNGNLWYHNWTNTATLNHHVWMGCWSGSWSGSWQGTATGSLEGIFDGYFSGSIGEGSYFSGSFSGSFVGLVSGSFSGSGILYLSSSSIDYLSTDTSLSDISGGGTWYVDYTNTVRGGCLVGMETPICSCFESMGSDCSDDSGSCDTTSSLRATQSFNYETSDIHMDVTNIVSAWINGTIPNNGFILKHSHECDANDYGQLRFFSKDTNTIYVPTLECKWDDSQFNPTGSSDPLTSNEKVVYVKNVRPAYKNGSVVRFSVFGREKYPERTFFRYSDYLESKYLPATTYYAIKDAESEEVWIDFDEKYSKVSCDSNGNYFTLDTTGLPQERFFKIIIKVDQNGTTEYYEDPSTFKITR